MNKKYIIAWLIGFIILIFLFLMSSTDLIIKDKKKEIHEITIFISDNMEDYHSALKKGIDKASSEFNADVNIINIENLNDLEILELVKSELNDGVKALIFCTNFIFSNEDGKKYIKLLEEVGKVNINDIPIIILGEENYGFGVTNIGIDYYETGKDLFNNISKIEDMNKIKKIFFYSVKTYDTSTVRVMQSFIDSINSEMSDIQVEFIDKDKLYIMLENGNIKDNIFIAVDNYDLTSMLTLMDDYKFNASAYGIGNTIFAINKMNDGLIKGIEVFNEYKLGYLFIDKAIRNTKDYINENIIIDSFFADRDIVKKKEVERVLYPID